MRFRGSMPSIIEGRAERLPTAPSGIAGLMDRLPQKNTAFSEAVRKLKEQIRNQQMPQPMPGSMPQVDMQNIPQIPTRESIQDYVRENIDLSNLQSRIPNFQMFQEGGFVGTMGGPNILAGIGNIPGLNLDFSKLPKNIDFSNLDLRAINANPQGFQDMIERARAQEGQQGSLPVENSMGMAGTLGGPGYGEYPLGTAGPRVDPSDPNYIPPPTNRPTIQAPVMQTGGNDPFVSGATRIEAGLDPLSRQLLFGLDGRGGFIPGAFRAAERTFFTPEGEARVIPEEIAGLTPDQLRAMEIARQTGVQDPYLQQSRQAYERGLGALGQGFGRAEAEQRRAVQDVLGGVSQAEALRGRGLAGLTGALGEAGQIARGATGIFGAGLRDPESLLRGTLGGYDPRMTEQFTILLKSVSFNKP